jgi:hypothetical protein
LNWQFQATPYSSEIESELLLAVLGFAALALGEPNAAVVKPALSAITLPITVNRRPHVLVVIRLPLFGAACILACSLRMRAITLVLSR